MGFNKNDFKNLDKRIETITTTDVKNIVNNEGVPSTNYLEDNNKVYETIATILFIDIRKSTLLTDMSKPQSMVKIYRSFMRTCVDCVRKNNGVTRQFLGDRIMAVFVDEKNENGDLINRGIDNALNTARAMQTCIDFSLNKHLKDNVNGKVIECGIGIDSGKILVTKVGMYGVENDDTKDNEIDCVWVGKITNYASKFSDIAKGGEILISEKVYNDILPIHKGRFKKTINIKNGKEYLGYSAFNYYLDFIEELDKPIKPDISINSVTENDEYLVQIVDRLDKKYKDLLENERNLTLDKEKLNEEIKLYNSKCRKMYDIFYGYLKSSFCDDNYKMEKEYEFFEECINNYYFFGEKLGYSSLTLKQNICFYLIDIYNYYGIYEKALNHMILMIKNSTWVYLKKETIQWAKKSNKLYDLSFELDWKIKECNNSEKEEWKKYKEELTQYEEGN